MTSQSRLFLFALLFPAFVCAESVRGVWVSPDWLLQGDRTESPERVRQIVRQTVTAVQRLGGNAIFLETLIRGQLIGPCGSGSQTLPVYPLCRQACWTQAGKTEDLLSLFIEEGRSRNIDVHAWIHCFYWRSDNRAFRKPWHDGPTIYDDLLVRYLNTVAGSVRSLPRRRAAAEMARALSRGFSWEAWNRIANRWGIDSFEGTFNNFVRFVESCDGPPPDFLLTNPKGELHFGMEQDRILAVYVNPEFQTIGPRLVWLVQRIVGTHPGLAGIQLDHIRYPRGPFGGPGEFDAFPKAMRTTLYSPNRWEVGEVLFDRFVARREARVTDIVNKIRSTLPAGMKLTAAVHPTYYEDRDARSGPIVMEAYMGQDWANWPIDFAVPMIYNATPGRIDELLSRARRAASSHGTSRVSVVPGISSRKIASSYGRGRSWLLFDFEGLSDLIQGIPGSAVPSMGLKDRMF